MIALVLQVCFATDISRVYCNDLELIRFDTPEQCYTYLERGIKIPTVTSANNDGIVAYLCKPSKEK